jgi:uncharacterized protein YndB with AHSA1/START domain
MAHTPAETAVKPFVISRVLNTPRELVWKAWTERDRLVAWFGPKGCLISHAKMDFRPGGMFHYAMKLPNGVEMWGKFVYQKIVPPDRLEWLNCFSDANAGLGRHPMAPQFPAEMYTVVTFTEQNRQTTVTITWQPHNATPEECAFFNTMHSGMTQGWTGTFEQLEEYLAKSKA